MLDRCPPVRARALVVRWRWRYGYPKAVMAGARAPAAARMRGLNQRAISDAALRCSTPFDARPGFRASYTAAGYHLVRSVRVPFSRCLRPGRFGSRLEPGLRTRLDLPPANRIAVVGAPSDFIRPLGGKRRMVSPARAGPASQGQAGVLIVGAHERRARLRRSNVGHSAPAAGSGLAAEGSAASGGPLFF